MVREDDLIKDSALESKDGDLFDHQSVAKTVIHVLRNAHAPANIAMYGPWGTGKSGLSNLIKADLLNLDEGFKFVRFDAFKYAENPLRKHILSVMAETLLCQGTAKKFKESLYKSESSDKIIIPPVELMKMLMLLIITMLLISISFSFIFALFPLIEEAVELSFFEKVGRAFPEMLLPSSILSALVTLWGKTFTTKTTRNAPSHEEEFEQRFSQLVQAATPLPTHKIVIFVDELDRCSGEEIVNVLDTIRTFMDSKKCIFIIAVDRHVLSASLKAKLVASGPIDKHNPQYGSVDEYLNKVFQYQVSMPPVRPQRLTDFAMTMVKDKQGVWSKENVNVREVINILIPPNIANPRRVKALLNSFVLTYRLAEERVSSKSIRNLTRQRVQTLAKMVFLRNEFPKFFEHLRLDYRLPEMIVKSYKQPEYDLPPDIKDDVRELVPKYAELKITHHDYLSQQMYLERSENETKELQSAIGVQLLRYLSMTEHLEPIDPELIYLESIGYTNELEPEFASELESLAISNLTNDLGVMLIGLNDTERRSAINLLLHQTPLHDYEITLQGMNVGTSLLELAAGRDIDFGDLATTLIDKTLRYLSSIEDSPKSLIGAVKLAEKLDQQRRDQVFDLVMSHVVFKDSVELLTLVLSQADFVDNKFTDKFSEIVALNIANKRISQDLVEILINLTEQKSRTILKGASSLIGKEYLRLFTEKEEEEEEEEKHSIYQNNLNTLKSAFEKFSDENRSDLTDIVAWFLNGKENIDWLRFLLTKMRGGWKPSTRELALNILGEFSYFIPINSNVRADWLNCINSKLLIPNEDKSLFLEIESTVLNDFASHNQDKHYREQYFPNAIQSIRQIKNESKFPIYKETTHEAIEIFQEKFKSILVTDTSSLSEISIWIDFVNQLSKDNSIIDTLALNDAAIKNIIELLTTTPSALMTSEKLSLNAITWLELCLNKASVNNKLKLIKALDKGSLHIKPTYLPFLNLLSVLEYNKDNGKKTYPRPYNALEVMEITKGSPSKIRDKTLAVWINSFCDNLEEFVIITGERYSDHQYFSPDLKESIKKYTQPLNQKELQSIATTVFESLYTSEPTSTYLSLLRFSDLDEKFAERLLLKAAKEATNNSQRKCVFIIWNALELSNQKIIDLLVNRIYLHYFKINNGSATASLQNFDLITSCSDTVKLKVSKAFNTHKDQQINARARKLLATHNFEVSGK